MTTPDRQFPDVERTLVSLLGSLLPDQSHAGTHTPDDFTGKLPFIRVVRVGGPDDGITDACAVEVDVFHDTGDAARGLAERVRRYLTSRWHRSGATVIDRVTTETGPHERPWGDNVGTRRFGASYTVFTRRSAVV